jgi:hypothetical protein
MKLLDPGLSIQVPLCYLDCFPAPFVGQHGPDVAATGNRKQPKLTMLEPAARGF